MSDQKLEEIKGMLAEIGNKTDANAEAIAGVVKDVAPIVEAHSNLVGTIKVGQGLQKFMLWVVKWGVIGSAAVWFIESVCKIKVG